MERRSHKRKTLSIPVELITPLAKLQGTSRDVGPDGLSLAVPSVRLKFSPSSLLDAPVVLKLDQQELGACLKWYTLDDSNFVLGFEVALQDRANWLKLLNWSALA